MFRWLCTGSVIIGSVLIAMNAFPAAFYMYGIAGMLWIYEGYRTKDTPILVLNLWLTLMNAIAIYNWYN